ncbi:MAG: DUF6291 domain-containing protein [Treponema sp.]|jgi:hypothetical protein|nr:DUF6291 domain-containing protein [Treponema sp.]
MTRKEGFLLYYKTLENLKTLGNDIAMEVIYAMARHDQGEDVGELSQVAQFAFNAYVPYLDKSKKRWEAKVNNGNKGGRPKNNNPKKPETNLKKPIETEDKPKETDNDDNVTENENGNENEPVCESETNKQYFIKQWNLILTYLIVFPVFITPTTLTTGGKKAI